MVAISEQSTRSYDNYDKKTQGSMTDIFQRAWNFYEIITPSKFTILQFRSFKNTSGSLYKYRSPEQKYVIYWFLYKIVNRCRYKNAIFLSRWDKIWKYFNVRWTWRPGTETMSFAAITMTRYNGTRNVVTIPVTIIIPCSPFPLFG